MLKWTVDLKNGKGLIVEGHKGKAECNFTLH